MSIATNLLLEGSGVPTKRWGSKDFFLAGEMGHAHFVLPIKDNDNSINVLALSDWGLLTKKSGSSYAIVGGASWPSGANVEGTQLGGNVYLVSTDREMVRYNFTDLDPFETIGPPSSLAATNVSGVSGTLAVQWSVTAVGGAGGETIGSTALTLTNLPQDLTTTSVLLSWTAPSAASGSILGYNVYRNTLNEFRWIGGTDSLSTEFYDVGVFSADPTKLLPTTNTTAGLRGKHIIRYQDRLIIAGVPGFPTRVWISGRWPYHERFDVFAGGSYIEIEAESGENVTGLGIHQEKLVVFKENSVWEVQLLQEPYGQYFVLEPKYKLLTASQGCSSHRSITPVENDLMFINRKGIYILRHEPQLLTVINANEISAKIRPFFEGLSDSDITSAAAVYVDKKYIVSFPESRQSIIFDRERLSFMGPWTTPFGIAHWAKYVDENGMERWVAADSDDSYITEFSKNLTSDKGIAITTNFKSRKEDFKDWTIYKTINEAYMNFRNVIGQVDVNIYIEERSGRTIAAKSFTVTGAEAQGVSGMGIDLIGSIGFGLTGVTPLTSSGEYPKKSYIYKTARTIQFEIRTTGFTDNYELLGIKAIAIPQNRGNNPSSWLI